MSEKVGATAERLDNLDHDNADLAKRLEECKRERELEARYTEALVKQRDNMKAIVENSGREMEDVCADHRVASEKAAALQKRCHDMEEELVRTTADVDGARDECRRDAAAAREEMNRALAMKKEAEEGAESLHDELMRVRERSKKDAEELERMRGGNESLEARAEALGQERERYNTTVKALKTDLRVLHKGDAGTETSLQEHMRLLNTRWDDTQTRLEAAEKLKAELQESVSLIETAARERERTTKEHADVVASLEAELREAQNFLDESERMKRGAEDRLSESGREASDSRRRLEEDVAAAEQRVSDLERRLDDCQRSKDEAEKRLSDLGSDTDKRERHLEEKASALEHRLSEVEGERSSQRKEFDRERRTLETELDKARSREKNRERDVVTSLK